MTAEVFIAALKSAKLDYEPQSCGKQQCGTRQTSQTKLD